MRRVIILFVVLTLAGCAQKDVKKSFTQQEAKLCVLENVQATQRDPEHAKVFADTKHVRKTIADSFEVGQVFLFLNRGAILSALKNLQSALGDETLMEIAISEIVYPKNTGEPYVLIGTVGELRVEFDTLFYADGTCKAQDIRVDGISMLSTLIGRLATEPPFDKHVGLDPYDE